MYLDISNKPPYGLFELAAIVASQYYWVIGGSYYFPQN